MENLSASVADPDFELSGGLGSVLLSLPVVLRCDFFVFFTQNRGKGPLQTPWVPPLDPPLGMTRQSDSSTVFR